MRSTVLITSLLRSFLFAHALLRRRCASLALRSSSALLSSIDSSNEVSIVSFSCCGHVVCGLVVDSELVDRGIPTDGGEAGGVGHDSVSAPCADGPSEAPPRS